VIAAAVAFAVAVAASRVLLDLHWLSDVIGGLSLGWAWFALCAIVFGGQVLRPTAAADIASAQAAAPKHPRDAAHTRRPPLETHGPGPREHRLDPSRRASTGRRAPGAPARGE
jgi:undecaprenyl-diphosphatase